jgi:hypothetical protein
MTLFTRTKVSLMSNPATLRVDGFSPYQCPQESQTTIRSNAFCLIDKGKRMNKNEWLRTALIIGGVFHLYIILNQLFEPGQRSFLTMIVSLIPFLTIVSPGLLLNALAYFLDNRTLAFLAAVMYIYSGFYFILTMLWLVIPGSLCLYASVTMGKPRR